MGNNLMPDKTDIQGGEINMKNPISYMERTRLYYRAQGFNHDYKWAHHLSTPFEPLAKPLSTCTVTVVTTGVMDATIPKPVRKAMSIPFVQTPKSFDTSEVAWDRETTHTNDRGSYFPLETLTELVEDKTIAAMAARFHFVPTQYSHRATMEEDAPVIRDACLNDAVDIAILIPL